MAEGRRWLQQGGNYAKGNHLRATSLTVSNFTLINAYEGTFTVRGLLNVYDTATFNANVIAGNLRVINTLSVQSLNVENNLITDRDVNINGNLSVASGKIYAYNGIDLSGNLMLYNNILFRSNGTGSQIGLYPSSTGNFGINVPAPLATLDISGINVNTIDVHTTQSENRNVLARNVNNRGITLYANTTTSRIGFYNDSIISNSSPDAQIEYTRPGILTLDVSDNTIIASRLAVSTTGQNAHLLNETAIIYDTSAASTLTPYLFDTYENATARTGQTLTLVSVDNSANTFFNVVAPNRAGLSIGGGNYLLDSTRSMATIGLRNQDEYYPAINLISGNSRLQYKRTVGINTHAPMVDDYVVDLNGPIHIANGEITLMKRTDFEIVNLSISRSHPLYGVAIGTPYLFSNLKYKHKVLYTTDGGENWNISLGLSGSIPEEVLTVWNDVCVFDNLYSIIVSDYDNAPIYYSINSGLNWNSISGIEQSVNSAYISQTKRVFVSLSDKSVKWFNSPNNIYTSSGFAYDETGIFGTIELSTIFSRIIQIDGYGNYLFIIGQLLNGGGYGVSACSNINATPSVATIIHQQSSPYKSISVLDEQTIVIVGTNVISYTNNRTVWTNITHSHTLNSVYAYNSQLSVAVGNNGTVLYSLDGNHTWLQMSIDSIRSSGTEGLLLDSQYHLSNVVMTNNHNVIISQTSRAFVWNPTNPIYGISKVINGFLPNVFDNPHNFILDLSGSSRIAGDVCVSNGGKLTTSNNAFYLINENAQTIYFGNDASLVSIGNNSTGKVLFNRNIQVQNDSSLNANVYIGGNTHLYKSLFVSGDASLNANLSVLTDSKIYGNLDVFNHTTLRGRSYFLNDASLGANLIVLRDASLNGRVSVGGILYATNDASLNGRLSVGGAASFGGGIYSSSDASLGGNLFVLRDSSLNGRLSVGGDLYTSSDASLGGNLVVLRDASFNGRLSVDGAAFFRGGLYIVSDASLGGNLVVVRDSSLNGNLSVGGAFYTSSDASLGGNLVVLRDASLNGRLSVDGAFYTSSDASLGGNLVVLRDASLNGRLAVDGGASFGGGLYTSSDASLGGNLVVLRDASLNGRLAADGAAFFRGGLYTFSDASLGGNLVVLRDASLNGRLAVDGAAFFRGGLYTFSDASLGGNLVVLRDASLNGRLAVDGALYTYRDASFGANLNVMRDASFNGNIKVNGVIYAFNDVSLNSNLTVLRDTSFNGRLIVGESTTIMGTLYGVSDASFGANLIVVNDSSLNGRLTVGGSASFSGGLYSSSDASFGSNLIALGDASFNGQLRVGSRVYVASDASFGANLSVLHDSSLNGRLAVGGEASFGSGIYVSSDASLGGNLIVLRDASFNGNLSVEGPTHFNSQLYLVGDACFNGNVVVQKDQSNMGNLYVGQNTIVNNSLTVRNVAYSKYYEGSGNNADIFIGGLGLTTNDGSPTPFRTISIGNSGGMQNTQNIIRIGGGNDTIILGGENSGIGIEKINAGKYIFVNKVGNIGTFNSSSDAGMYIVDNSNDFAGYIAVSKDMLGYKFKAPYNVSDPNILKININDMVLPSGVSTGLVSLKRTSPISAFEVDSSFTLAVGTFDISNVLLKKYSATYDAENIQIIDTSLGILGNAYVLNHFSVGKPAASPANTVDISGILYTDKIAVSTASTNINYQVEVSGNMFQSNGYIWQF